MKITYIKMLPVVFGLLPLVSHASSWQLKPEFEVSDTQTDNLFLVNGNGAESDNIISLEPSLKLRKKGAHLDVSLDARLEKLIYKNNSQLNALNKLYTLSVNSELVDQMFFLDGYVKSDLQNISSRNASSSDNIGDSSNRQKLDVFTITPIFKHHLGRIADIDFRSTYTKSKADLNTSSSTIKDHVLSFVSGRAVRKLPWSLSFSKKTIDLKSGNDSEFQNINFSGQYVLNRKYSLTYSLGQQDNTTSTGLSDQKGNTWNAGILWTPSLRTSLNLGYGKQVAGKSFSFAFNHRSKRTFWYSNYSQTTITQAELQTLSFTSTFRDRLLASGVSESFINANTLTDTIEQDLIAAGATDEIIDQLTFSEDELAQEFTNEFQIPEVVVVNTNFSVGMALKGKRTTLNIDASTNTMESTSGANNQETRTINTQMKRTLSRKSTLSANARYSDTDYSVDGRKDKNIDLTVGYEFKLSEHAKASLDLNRHARISSAAGSSYSENRAKAGIRLTF